MPLPTKATTYKGSHTDSKGLRKQARSPHLNYQTAPVQALFPRSNNFENSSFEAGGTATSERFARTCSTRLVPTSAVVIPGVERTNCNARSASFCNPSAAATNGGRPRDNFPCNIAALATSVIPSLFAASTIGSHLNLVCRLLLEKK